MTDTNTFSTTDHPNKAENGDEGTGKLRSPRSGAVTRFIRKPSAEKRILAEAFLLAALTRFVIRFCSFRMLKRLIGEPSSPNSAGAGAGAGAGSSPLSHPASSGEPVIITRSVTAVSRRVPWESKCLVQAATARMMLNRRGIPNELYLGVSKTGLKGIRVDTDSGMMTGTDPEKIPGAGTQKQSERGKERDIPAPEITPQPDMRPHAWLVVNGVVLLGGGNLDDYVTVSRFGD